MDLRWVASCNLGYFAGKCQASEEGRRYEVWSEEAAHKWIKEHAETVADDFEYGLSEQEEESIHDEAAKWLTEELKRDGAKAALEDPKLWDEFVGSHPEHFGNQGTWLSSETDDQFKLEDIVYELIMEGDYRKEVFRERWLQKYRDSGGGSAMEDEHSYVAWMREHGEELFGDNWWELGSPGHELAIRCEGHLVGLKKAFAWLDAQKEEVPVKEDVDAPELADTPRCPHCGYTDRDAALHGDHHLCGGKLPAEQKEEEDVGTGDKEEGGQAEAGAGEDQPAAPGA